MQLTAEEARKITRDSQRVPLLDPHIKALQGEIFRLAKLGKSNFNPWQFLAADCNSCLNSLDGDQKLAIREHFMNLGYVFMDYPNPDPGHSCSRTYTLMSW